MIEDALSFLWRSLVGTTKEDDENWMEYWRNSDKFKNESDEERIMSMYCSGLRDCSKETIRELIQVIKNVFKNKS